MTEKTAWFLCVWILVLFLLSLLGTVAAEEVILYGAETCGRCHASSESEISASVHASNLTGDEKVSCLSCHASHGKTNPEASNVPLTHGNDVMTCGKCHATQVDIFNSTYHGKHLSLGKKNIPTCVFCHAGHELPYTEALSPINTTNIGLICAGCHGETEENKIRMAAMLSTPATGRTLYRKDIMVPLTIKGIMGVLTLGVFALGLLFVLQWVRNLRGEPLPERSRWPRWLWVQLLFFLIFFILLDQTGITLLYSSLSQGLISYPMQKMRVFVMSFSGTDDIRSLIHRLTGLGLIAAVAVHLLCLVFSSTLRRCVRLPENWWRSLLEEIKRGITSGKSVSAVKGQILYWTLFVSIVVMVITGIAQWKAFWLMESVGLWAVRYTDIIHEWTGRILAMAVYGILIGYGVVLRTVAQKTQPRKKHSQTALKTMAAITIILGLLILSGCSSNTETSIPAQNVHLSIPPESPSRGSTVTSPVPGVTANIFPSAKNCKGCHPREYKEWKKSYHSRSIHTPTFKAMYTIFNYATKGKRPEYCFYCHDPATKLLGRARAEELSIKVLNGEDLPSEGVTCTSCHMVKDVDAKDYDWTAPAAYNVNSVPPYHSVFRSDLTRSSDLCSYCHDYNNLNIPHPEKPTTPCCTVNRGLAKTEYVREGITCQSCHMRDTMEVMKGGSKFIGKLFSLTGLQRYLDDRNRVSHLMPGSRDAEMLKRAVKMRFVSADVQDGMLRVELELENKAGHSIPDG